MGFVFLHLSFRSLAVRDVVGDSHCADDLALLVSQRQLRGERPRLVAIGPAFLFLFSRDRFAGTDDLLLVRERLFRMLRTEEIEVRLVYGLRRIVQSELRGHRPAEAHKTAVAILEIDGIRNMLQEGLY